MLAHPIKTKLSSRLLRNGIIISILTVLLLIAGRFLTHRVVTPYSRLMEASESNNVAAVKIALDQGANVDGLPESQEDEGVSPLGAAAEAGHVEIVRLLIDRGADVNLRDGWETPLTAAAENDKVEVVKLLIERGAKVNDSEEGSYALWRAAVDGKVAAVRELLAHGANPNTHYEGGTTSSLLQVVVDFHHPDVAAVLRKAGAK